MRKKLSLLMVALFAITAFAAQIWKAETEPTVLINYPTSSDGIKISGTTKSTTVKIHTNKDAVNCYQLANGYTTDGAYNNNSISLGVEGGFKAGDVITIAGAINNSSSEKRGTAVLFTMDSEKNITNLHQFSDFINGRLVNDEPVEESYTLEADADSLYLGRDGNTGANLTLIKVVRPASSGGDEPTPSDEHYYKKVTSTSDLTDGDYLIVYEDGGVALDGALSVLDATGNNFNVTITDNQIASSDAVDGAVFTIEGLATTSTTGGYSIKSASGFYIGQETDANGLASNAETVYANQISFETNGDANIVGAGGAYLRYNAASNQARFRYYKSSSYTGQKPVALYKKVDGALTPADIATPVIEGETPFVGSTTVTISCETEGATIYYSTDGVDPTDQSTAYTEPFELTESATVKAIAYDVSGAKSAVASKVFEATPSVATIAAMNALENDAAFGFTGNALIVAKPTAKHVFIKDDTGSSLLYDNSGEKTAAAEVGKVIAPNWTAKVSIYKNLFEAVPDAAIEVTSDDPVDVTYPEVELAYITAEHVNEVVTLKGVNYTAPDNKNFNVTKGTDNTVAGYNQFGIEIANPDETKTYDIVGAIGRYNDNIQFQPITITEAADEPAPEEITDLYIVGDFDGWNTATNTPNLVKMTYNEETEAFEKEVTVTSKAYFVFGDVASSDSWEDFNANNRYAASDEEAEVVEGQPIQLQKATGTLTISNPGTYTLSVTKDLLLSITQTSAGQDTYIVAGTPSSIFGTEWDGTNEANKMTFDEATGTYSITYNVTEATNDVQLKVVKNQSEWIGDATGNNVTFNVTSPCEITVTYNPETGEITVTGDGVVFPTDFTYEAVYAVGNGSEGWLNNVAWDPAAEANKMTEVEEDVWEITYSAVPVGTGYQVKFAIDGGWTNNFGGTFAAFNEETDAVYNGDNIIFDVADEAKDITIRLDLKDFDFASKTGAKFTIKTAGEEPEPEPTADGDIISWTADDIASAGGTASSYSVGDFVLNVVDTDGKIAVDANTAYFGDATAQKKFTHRLKTGGKSSSKNSLTLTVPSAGKVKVYVRTGSNSATDRNLTLTQNGTTLYDKVVQESDAVQVAEDDLNVTNEEPAAGAKALAEGDPATVKVYPAVEIDAVAGTVEIGYPTGSLNFYGFEFISDEVTGIQNVETLDINPMFDENLPAYNLAGQRVDKNYRGVVIQKGKKFFNK